MAKKDNSDSGAEKINVSVRPASSPATPAPVETVATAVAAADYQPTRIIGNGWTAGIAALVIIGLVLGLLTHNGGKAVFTINGVNYDKKTVARLSAYEINVDHQSAANAAKTVYQALRYQTAAQSMHIKPTGLQIANAKGTIYPQIDSKKYQSWYNVVVYNTAVQDIMSSPAASASQGSYQGYAYLFYFGNTIVSPVNVDPPANFGDSAAYQKDQAYAKQRADYYHDQLAQKKMTADQVLAAVKGDSKLAEVAGEGHLNESVKFGYSTNTAWQDQFIQQMFVRAVLAQDKTGLTSILTGQVATDNQSANPPMAPAYYYFFDLTRVHGPNLQQQFGATQAKIKAVYYGL